MMKLDLPPARESRVAEIAYAPPSGPVRHLVLLSFAMNDYRADVYGVIIADATGLDLIHIISEVAEDGDANFDLILWQSSQIEENRDVLSIKTVGKKSDPEEELALTLRNPSGKSVQLVDHLDRWLVGVKIVRVDALTDEELAALEEDEDDLDDGDEDEEDEDE